jgi:hypothetical protein
LTHADFGCFVDFFDGRLADDFVFVFDARRCVDLVVLLMPLLVVDGVKACGIVVIVIVVIGAEAALFVDVVVAVVVVVAAVVVVDDDEEDVIGGVCCIVKLLFASNSDYIFRRVGENISSATLETNFTNRIAF